MKHYRNLYTHQKRQCSQLKKEMDCLNKEHANLQKKIARLQTIISNCNEDPQCKKTRKHKKWDSIKTDKTKRQRLGCYRDVLFGCLSQIEKCHRAEISLWLDTNRIQFSWSPKDFKHDDDDDDSERTHSKQLMVDHSYASQRNDTTENEHDYQDVNFSEIFDCAGNWKKSHIRSLIHVLDSFRISQEAYHELRMVSKGHLPPLCRLSREKAKMSEEIPYEKIPNVRLIFNGHVLCTVCNLKTEVANTIFIMFIMIIF